MLISMIKSHEINQLPKHFLKINYWINLIHVGKLIKLSSWPWTKTCFLVLLLFGYSRKDNIISKERRLIREREMSWQFVNLHPKMYFTKYCFIRNTYYIVLYIICISFECVLVIDWLLLHIPTRYRHWYRYTCLYDLCISVFTKYDNAYAPRV